MSSIDFERFRAEPDVRRMLSHYYELDNPFGSVLRELNRGDVEESLGMGAVLFAYFMDRGGVNVALKEFNATFTDLLFAWERGELGERYTEAAMRQLDSLLGDYIAWSGSFIQWGESYQDDSPKFPWREFLFSLAPLIHMRATDNLAYDVSRAQDNVEGLLRGSAQQPLERMLLSSLDWYTFNSYQGVLSFVAGLGSEEGGEEYAWNHRITPYYNLPLEDRVAIASVAKPIAETYQQGDFHDAVRGMVLEHGGAFTPENLLAFASLVKEYNWEWATAAMEWDRARSEYQIHTEWEWTTF